MFDLGDTSNYFSYTLIHYKIKMYAGWRMPASRGLDTSSEPLEH
jgi:hypothetical protein